MTIFFVENRNQRIELAFRAHCVTFFDISAMIKVVNICQGCELIYINPMQLDPTRPLRFLSPLELGFASVGTCNCNL